jgi:hypothetical protein
LQGRAFCADCSAIGWPRFANWQMACTVAKMQMRSGEVHAADVLRLACQTRNSAVVAAPIMAGCGPFPSGLLCGCNGATSIS